MVRHSSGQPTHEFYGLNEVWSDIIIQGYGTQVLGVQLAQSQHLPSDEVAHSRAFHFQRRPRGVNSFDFFQHDDNEWPEVGRRPLLEDDYITVCQEFKMRDKVSYYERWLLNKQWPMIEKLMADDFREGLALRLDDYIISTCLASAAQYNQGNHAGKLTRRYNLGSQDQNALTITTGADLERLILTMRTVGKEAGMFTGTADVRLEGGPDARPILLIPAALELEAALMIRELANICQDCSAIRNYNGHIGRVWGIDIYTTQFLRPVDMGAAVGQVAPIMLVDPNYVWSFFDVISSGEDRHLFEYEFGVHVIYDAAVLEPDAIVIADVKVPQP